METKVFASPTYPRLQYWVLWANRCLPYIWHDPVKNDKTRYLRFPTKIFIRFWVSGSTSIDVQSWSFFFTFQKQDKKLGPHFCSLIHFVLEVITLLFYKLRFFFFCLLGSYCVGPFALLLRSSCVVQMFLHCCLFLLHWYSLLCWCLLFLHCFSGPLVLFLVPFVTTQLFQAQISFEPSSQVWCLVFLLWFLLLLLINLIFLPFILYRFKSEELDSTIECVFSNMISKLVFL